MARSLFDDQRVVIAREAPAGYAVRAHRIDGLPVCNPTQEPD